MAAQAKTYISMVRMLAAARTASGRSVADVARDLNLAEKTIRRAETFETELPAPKLIAYGRILGLEVVMQPVAAGSNASDSECAPGEA